MIVLESILSQEIIQKLGWTLLHFIWQAAVLAIFLAILLRILRKSTANLRYIFACMALGLIVLLPVITIQLVPVSAPHMAAHIEPAPVPTVLPTLEMPTAETIVFEEPVQPESVSLVSADSWKQRTVGVLEPALPYIVSGWLLGVFGLSLWHLGGWAQLQRLRRKMVKQVDDTLHSKLKDLAERLKVNRMVQLVESALVQIPTVVGWLRPVILLPASALTGLSAEQLEAILAHELAHIRRHDYLINILQTIVEILGFYHPAVWWVSHKIRAERENCCDDLAVSISGDRVCYARALTSMEEIRAGHGQLAVAAGGGNLFKRIYRLVGKESGEKTGFSWIPAATAILLILALVIPTALALTTKSNPPKAEPNTDTQVTVKEFGSNNNSETGQTRIVHFPKERAVGTLKVRDTSSDDDSDRGLLSLPGWILLGQAQGDVSVPAGKDLRLEVSGDITDFSFLADLKPDDLQALKLSQTGISDEDLVHLKSLSGLLGLDLDSTSIKGAGLVHIAPLTSLRKLSLFNTQVSDAGLAHLSTLRSLKYLNLYITQVRGPGLKHLKNLTSLVSLDLAATPITDESLAHLAEMTWLKELQLQDTDIGNKGLANLKPLRSLEELILGNAGLRPEYSPITDEGLVYLKELGSLKNLYLLRTRVTDAGLAHLRNLKKLEALLLTETQITGEGLAFLKDLLELKYLDLNKTAVTDKGLVYLKDLKSLSKLYISSDSISEADLEDLEKAMPNCTINGRKSIATVRPLKSEPILAQNEQDFDMQVKGKPDKTSGKLAANRAFFTPPIARIINSAVERKDCFIDFDNDKLYSQPSDFHSRAREQQEVWKRENSIDASATVSEGAEGLWGEEMVIIPLADVEFDRMTPVSFRDVLQQATPGTPAVMTAIGQLPKTYVFKTREGGMGLLQILEIQRKRSPHYIKIRYKMVPRTVEADVKITSNKNLQDLGKAMVMFARDHQRRLPDSLQDFAPYLRNKRDIKWLSQKVKYLGKGKTENDRPDTVIAYDSSLLLSQQGTNVLFLDAHVEYVQADRLEKLGISETEIQIESRFLMVSEDFLKDIGLDANSVHSSDPWSEHLVAESAAEPNAETYSLILDDLHVSFLLKAVGAHKGAKMLTAPRATVWAGKEATIALQRAMHYISGYTEPNRPSDEPEPKHDSLIKGLELQLTPNLTPDDKNILLDVDFKLSEVIGFEERKYKGKYPYSIPQTEVVSTKTRRLVPDGKTLLIGGLKIIEQVEHQSDAPRLSDLPLIGVVFSRSTKTRDHKMLLILVKPIINPQQKASKILPGEADSEEHIKSLGRLLEKKLNPPAEPK